ncbi:MAG: hypothetical protein H5T99_08055 [Moorella sp. (in: Bacteria)]|nr:hypothetical protein [Moorella sp. (in: firmicutes)]
MDPSLHFLTRENWYWSLLSFIYGLSFFLMGFGINWYCPYFRGSHRFCPGYSSFYESQLYAGRDCQHQAGTVYTAAIGLLVAGRSAYYYGIDRLVANYLQRSKNKVSGQPLSAHK